MQFIQKLVNIAPAVIVAALAIAMVAGYLPAGFEDLPIAKVKFR